MASTAAIARRCREIGAVPLWRAGVEQTASAQSLTDLRAQVRASGGAWNWHDASSVAAFYTHDADRVMGNGPRISGRDAITEWWARYVAAISDHRMGTFEVESLRPLTPDVALANVGTLTAGRDENNQELPARRALPAEGDVRVEPGMDR